MFVKNINPFIALLIVLPFFSSCSSRQLRNGNIVPEHIIHVCDSFSASFLQLHQHESADYKNAAGYLLDNFRYHSFLFAYKDSVYIKVINLFCDSGYMLRDKLDSMKQLNWDDGKVVYDADVVSAAYLDSNIRLALNAYNKSRFKKEVSFQNFCQYVLPYRVSDELVTGANWRPDFADSALLFNDSLSGINRMEDAAKIIHKHLREKYRHFSLQFGRASLNLGDLPLPVIKKLNTGTCKELSLIGAGTLRSLGIPACLDFTPNYMNLNSGHEWTAIVRDSLHNIPFDIASDTMQKYKHNTYMLPKVYRYGFRLNTKSHFFLKGFNPELSDCFNNPFITDVTASYIRTSNIKVPLRNPMAKKEALAYLAVFNRPNWVAVDWGEIKGDTAFFKNIGRGGVYISFIVDGQTEQMHYGDAFKVKEDGSVHYLLPDANNKRVVQLTRKYPRFIVDNGLYISRTIGGKFQGANRKDFKDAKDLFIIQSSPIDTLNIVNLTGKETFKYLRYLSPQGSYGNLSEAEFYENNGEKNVLLKGEIIGTEGSYQGHPQRTGAALFDENYLTYFDSGQADGSWAGIALPGKKVVTQIRFLARNDMNGIDKESTYELFYWDRGWKSLGKRTGQNYSLTYDNVPNNALLWLHNVDKGVEERPFTYENETQMWW